MTEAEADALANDCPHPLDSAKALAYSRDTHQQLCLHSDEVQSLCSLLRDELDGGNMSWLACGNWGRSDYCFGKGAVKTLHTISGCLISGVKHIRMGYISFQGQPK